MIPSKSNQRAKGVTHYDMVIVGGGMVGISLALILAKQGEWNILLIESNSLDVPTDSALSYSSSFCLLYTSPSPRDGLLTRMPSSA